MGTVQADQVKRRRVFYIPGYDPIHPRRYRELYRKEGAAQGAISGYEIGLKPKASGSQNYGWTVQSNLNGSEVAADFDVLVWSDIVRDSMSTSIPATYLQLVRTAWVYIGSGALWRLMKLRKGPVIAALYPVGMLLVQLALAIVAFTLAVRLIMGAAGFVAPLMQGMPMFATVIVYGAPLLGLVVGALVFVLLLRWFKKQDGKFFA
jgi:hypothetical protein